MKVLVTEETWGADFIHHKLFQSDPKVTTMDCDNGEVSHRFAFGYWVYAVKRDSNTVYVYVSDEDRKRSYDSWTLKIGESAFFSPQMCDAGVSLTIKVVG